jgi:hypothetical protein
MNLKLSFKFRQKALNFRYNRLHGNTATILRLFALIRKSAIFRYALKPKSININFRKMKTFIAVMKIAEKLQVKSWEASQTDK